MFRLFIHISAAFIICLDLLFGQIAHADDWGCEVLLCLSNPAGPMAVSECVPPIEKLYRELAKGRGMPSCAMSGQGNYAKKVFNPYPLCPQELEETQGWLGLASSGVQSVWRSASKKKRYEMVVRNKENDAWFAPGELGPQGVHGATPGYGAKACVSGYVDAYFVPEVCQTGGGDAGRTNCRGGYTVRVFERIEPLQPKSPRAIDIFINGQLRNRVHW